jgi:hypothetical protein
MKLCEKSDYSTLKKNFFLKTEIKWKNYSTFKMWKKSFFYKSECQLKSNPVKSETESLGKEIFFQFQI